MQLHSAQDFYRHGIEMLCSIEDQIIQALPTMIQAAKHEELRQGLEQHLKETRNQRDRLDMILQSLGGTGSMQPDKGLQGIIEQAETMLGQVKGKPFADAALIGAAQAVEHYEIACYGTACSLAERMGRDEDLQSLRQTLEEEKRTDQKLTEIAQRIVNKDALAA